MPNQKGDPGGPIGIFDSGVGGLSVLKEIQAETPGEELVYVADSAHVPYGSKSAEYIRQRSMTLTKFLLDQGAKAIVVACNTATAAAASHLRRNLDVPVIAMEPAVKPAAAATRRGVVGVLATEGTIKSTQLAALLERFGKGVEVVTQPGIGLVEQVEAGDLDGPETRRLVEKHTAPLLEASADTIVLGCTHYAFIRPLIADVVGPDVVLIGTGPAVARQVRRVLDTNGLLNPAARKGAESFWTSDVSATADRIFSLLLGRSVEVRRLPERYR
ncbi:MAG: glutamate racemase [Candidatus Dormibacteraeota bacterium]|nr:glutamate racemase [Candidatus Dormibacteraeota bacterium]